MLLVASAALGALSVVVPPVRGVRAEATAAPVVEVAIAPSDDLPDSEPVRLRTRDGRTLAGNFYEVPREDDPVPAVVLIHDLGAERTELEPIVERLVKSKFAVLSFDLRGHGESADEDCNWSKMDEEERARLVPFTLLDVNAALDWLMEDPRVRGVRTHVIGSGHGALLAGRIATDERVTSLTVLEPATEGFDMELADLLADAEGLSMQIASSRDDEERWKEWLVAEEIDDLVEVRASKGDAGDLFSDKRFRISLCRWIDERREGTASVRGTAGKGRR